MYGSVTYTPEVKYICISDNKHNNNNTKRIEKKGFKVIVDFVIYFKILNFQLSLVAERIQYVLKSFRCWQIQFIIRFQYGVFEHLSVLYISW